MDAINLAQGVLSSDVLAHLCFFYAIALCLANLANIYQLTIAGVKGQPALMWIDPLLIIPTIIVAKARGQYTEFWHGKFSATMRLIIS